MDPPLSASSLQRLVSPLRLMSACMWQVVQDENIRHYGKLEEFVSLVTRAVPEVCSDRKRLLLLLGLRAKVMTQQFDGENPYDLQTFLDRIGSFQITQVRVAEAPLAEFIVFLQSLLTDQEERQHFLQVFVAEFHPDFDAALVSLVCDFLSQLEEHLPVPNFKQVSSFFGASLSVDDCLTAVSNCDSLKSSLQGHLILQQFEVNNRMAETPVSLHAPAEHSEAGCLNTSRSDTRRRTTYMCPHCGENFTYQYQLVNHLHVHKEGGQFKCSECSESFKFSTSLLNHRRTTCNQAAAYSCLRCGSGFESFRRKLSHQCFRTSPVEGAKDADDEEAAVNFNGNSSHQRALLDRKQTYDCRRCGVSFRFLISYRRHLEKEHKMKTRAGQRLETVGRARKVCVTEGRRAPLRCSHCPLSFAKEEDLQIHLKSHQPLDCHKCGNSFADLASLVDHMADEHERKKSPAKLWKTSEKMALRCGHCDSSFSGIDELQEHRQANGIQHLTLDCHKCGVSFSDLTSLAQHVDEHDMMVYKKRFGTLCHLCGKFLRTNSRLKQHMRTHSNYRPHGCPHCGKRFSQKGNLTVHVRLHTGERPYVCSHCGKAFPSAGDLQVHQRFHTRTKPYQCRECSSRFYTASHLGLHMKRHRGELRFVCPQCGKRFLRKACLEKHLIIHTGLRPFLCSHCPKTFKRKSHLSCHFKRHHQ